jgi:hypothetical protein
MFMYVYISFVNLLVIYCISRAYLVLSTFCLSVLGYSQAMEALGITYVCFCFGLTRNLGGEILSHADTLVIRRPGGHVYSDLSPICRALPRRWDHAILPSLGHSFRRNLGRRPRP